MSNEKMVTCASCGNVRPEGTRFCGNCGTPFPQADQPSSPAEPSPTASSTGGRRLVWVGVAAVVALLVAGGVAAALSFTGGDGSPEATPVDIGLNDTSMEAGSTGGDCEDLTALVAKLAPLVGSQSSGVTSVEDLATVSEALSDATNEVPDEIRPAFETYAEAMRGILARVSDLGLEPGEVPDAAQTEELTQLFDELADDPELLDASFEISDWFESAASDCVFPTGTDMDTETDAADSGTGTAAGDVDELATAAVNDAMRRRTDDDSGIGGPPLGAEVRNCRKVGENSEDTLVAPAGSVYQCEVWYDGDRWADGPAVIRADGSVAVHP